MKELPINQIICGDTLTELKKFPSECIDMVLTSPPYYGLRDYGVEGQIGLEKTPEEYLEKLKQIMLEIKRVLKKIGTVWWNMGSTYNSKDTFVVEEEYYD
jgi:DNA modification methylase